MPVAVFPSATRRKAPTPRTLATLLLFLLAAGTGPRVDATESTPAQPAMAPASGQEHARPRIGLVLGGGGAKGAAHVGVLTLLEDMRIPVDCVIGTSMGALVGGTYAAGMTAAELEAAISAISWSEAIAFEGRRAKLPLRRKLAGTAYSNNLEFGYRDGQVTAPRGFINTQNIEQKIRYLVSRSLGTSDFDELPIPFRAIATDMMTGEMVVLRDGDLALSMRASMAVPGVFSPVTIDGRTLGDGGLTRNVAVDIARQTCADVVIAVAVPTPPPQAEALQSPLTMVSRTLDVLIGANEKQQLDTLGPQDVKIIVQMEDIGSGSFDRVADAIPLGRRAAEEHRHELRRYSLPDAEYRAWREPSRRPDTREVALADVTVTGLDRVNEAYVRSSLTLQAGDVVDQQQLATAMNRVFDLGDFDSVQYTLAGDPQNPLLTVKVSEKASGPNILRFDLGLAASTLDSTAFVLTADYLRPWLNALGGEMHAVLQLGRTSLGQFSLYQPLDLRHRWFVEPGAQLMRSTEDIYVGSDAATRYNFGSGYVYLEGGRVIGTSGEFRMGLRTGFQGAERDIAAPGLPNIDNEGYGGLTAGITFDNRDRAALATRGWLGRVRYYRALEGLGSEIGYDRVEGLALKAMPVFGDLLQFRASGGATLEGELPLYEYFTVGGPRSFPGLGIGELRGTSYWAGSVAYLHKIGDINRLFGQSLYVGAELAGADMSGRVDGRYEPAIFGGSLLLGGRTPLGPVTLSVATTTVEDFSVLFTLGRPIEERNIADDEY
jgi:NTE family protein